MKKLSNLLLAMLAIAAVTMTSCKKDEDEEAKPAPTISIASSSLGSDKSMGYASLGTKISLTVNSTTGENIKEVTVTKTTPSGTSTISGYPKTSDFTSKTSQNWQFDYTLVTGDDPSVKFTFKVTDSKGASATVEYTVNTLVTWTGKLLGGDIVGPHQFFSSLTGVTANSTSAVASDVDVTYQTGSGDEFISPADKTIKGSLTGLGATKFASSSLNFDNVTSAELSGAAAPSSNKVSVASSGVYLFENAAGKRGLIKVTAYTAGNNGSVTFSVKVQK